MGNYTVIHVDDLGMSRPANLGAVEAMDGAATCGSIMVPCPGYEEMVQIALARPELDVGCHITLNSEFPTFRWGPVLNDVPSLCDEDGFLWQKSRQTIAHADPAEVKREMRAQLELLLSTGVDVTHVDAHMGTAWDKAFYRDYVELALEYDLPVLVLSRDLPAEMLTQHGMRTDPDEVDALALAVEDRGFPVFQFVEADTPWYNPFVAKHHHTQRIDRLIEGSNYFILHSALGDEELKGFAADWMQRDSERYLFASGGELSEIFGARGISTLGMRELRDRARAKRSG